MMEWLVMVFLILFLIGMTYTALLMWWYPSDKWWGR